MSEKDEKDWPALSGNQDGTILGSFKSKLVVTKQRWAEEGRGMSGEAPASISSKPKRLPPGQRVTQDFPVLDLGLQPAVEPRDWRLTVSGLVDNPIDWGWEDFHAQPHQTMVSDIHCVTTWSRYDNTWEGLSAKQFLSLVRPRAEARFLIFHCHDGYSTNVPLSVFDDDDVILTHTWNGAPLAREHGGPIRPIIPKLYFWKSAKWVKHITFLAKDAPGYWEVRGYSNSANPWKEQRYT